ncbi:hypothetical protein D3C73_1240450 [compost metagenome]
MAGNVSKCLGGPDNSVVAVTVPFDRNFGSSISLGIEYGRHEGKLAGSRIIGNCCGIVRIQYLRCSNTTANVGAAEAVQRYTAVAGLNCNGELNDWSCQSQ